MLNFLKKVIKKHKYPILILIITWGFYFFSIFINIIEFKKDGIYVGHENVWSDWALHIGITNIFAYKEPKDWFSYHPMYAGGKFTYTFLTNFISGIIMRFGFSLKFAMIFPSIIYSIFLIFGIYFLFYLLSKSKTISLIGLNIFFLSSGPGFLKFLKTFNFKPSLNNFLYPSEHYSRLDKYAWYAGNFLVGMFVPQRSFLLGMPLALWSYILLLYVINSKKLKKIKQKKLLILAGLLAGLLPIAHIHSFIVLILLSGLTCLFNYKKWKILLFYILPASLLSSLLYLKFLNGGIENSNFMKFLPGWTVEGNFFSWVKMWWEIWGFTIPIALAGLLLILKKSSKDIKIFSLTLLFIFILANLVLFQPITWDNSKLFLWSYLGFSFMSACLLVKILKFKYIGFVFSTILFLLLTATGILEINRLWHTAQNQYLMTNQDDINLGIEIRQNTEPNERFLTAADHNHFIMIWANRPIMMGFTAWVLNFGFNYSQREQDIKSIYSGINAKQLINKYDISYIVIGPSEIRNFNINQSYFSDNYPLAFENETNKIYYVR